MSRKRKAVVLVGHRNAARRAAKAQGLAVLRVDSAGELPAASEVRARVDPSAVVALTEAAVLPAARLRAALDLPGLSVDNAKACTDKLVMKRAISAAGIACARFEAVDHEVDRDGLVASLGLPLVLKSRVGSGGRGARTVRAAAELPAVVERPCIAESFVEGVEMSVEAIVVAGRPVFVNCTEYVEPRWANLVPGHFDPATADAVHQVNEQAITALGVDSGITHMEVFLTANGPVFGELAARPPGGHIMRLMQLAYDFDPWAALLASACGELPVIATAASRSAGVRFIHPGPGIVQAVNGLDDIRAMNSLVELVCKLAPGDAISAREGTGQHHGFAMLAGTEKDVRRGLGKLRERLHVELQVAAG